MNRIPLLACVLFIAFMTNYEVASAQTVFDTQGHRGCRGLMPENTIPAMLRAVDLGVRTLEMDALITKDNKVVISHDPFFSHEITTKPNGDTLTEAEEKLYTIYKMTYAEIRSFDVGLKPHPRFPLQRKMPAIKPLLADLIDSVEHYTTAHKKTPVYYNIETKSLPETDGINHPSPDVFVELLVKVIMDKHIEARTIIQSFDIRTLIYLHSHYPQMKTALLIDEGNNVPIETQLKQLDFLPTIYSPHFSLITALLIETCHKQNIKVIPWTVNDLDKMKELKLAGVDGIISDYPNLFSAL